MSDQLSVVGKLHGRANTFMSGLEGFSQTVRGKRAFGRRTYREKDTKIENSNAELGNSTTDV